MALHLPGRSACVLCGDVLRQTDDVVSFPAFSSNPRDRLHRYSDGVSHRACLLADPDGSRAMRRCNELFDRSGPGRRACIVCDREILDPDDYFTLGHLTDNDDLAAKRFNHVQAHVSHLHAWPDLRVSIGALEELGASGEWDPAALDHLIGRLREHDW